MTSHTTRISTFVLMIAMMTAAPAIAQPAWQVAVDEINSAEGIFAPGNPAQPGVEASTFGALMAQTGAGLVGYNFNALDVALDPNLLIPAGLFDWGAAAEAFTNQNIHGLMSGAGAFAIDGDDSADLHVRWTMGVSYDAPGPPPGPLVAGNANAIVRANARLRLTDLIPGAAYTVSWEWASNGDADSATGHFNCSASGTLQMRLDGAPLPGFENTITTESATSNDGPADAFEVAGNGAFTFEATPGFTCDRELMVTVIGSATIQSPGGVLNELGRSTASTFGELFLHVEKQSTSPWEQQGDVNCDGDVNALDIEPFMTLLFDPVQHAARFPCCPTANADLNLDQHVTIDDLDLFVTTLLAG